MLGKIPSLKLKKWNATRWLGRSGCLKAMCGGYQHVLDHLQSVQADREYDKAIRGTATKLYE